MSDLISRQAAIDELDNGAWGVEWDKTLAKTMIEALPSAQPEKVWKEIAMKIERMTEIETNDIQIGDRLRVGRYTATCQTVTEKGATFLLDQYLDRHMPMNKKNTNCGGYDDSDLRKYLQSDAVLSDFEEIRPYMKPWNNGDLLRIPYYGEMFDNNDRDNFVEPDSNEQWPLMKDAHNRVASRCGELVDWGWLANMVHDTSAYFCFVYSNGHAGAWLASNLLGVRPAFLIA